MMMRPFDLNAYLTGCRERVEQALAACFRNRGPGISRTGRAMRYSLMAGGKRLRPVLCLAGCEAAGGDPGDAMPAACALEMIHTYSLIHDDLPAMDDDDLRRGRATCHKAFDEATAILAGDALLTLAFDTLSDIDPESPASEAFKRLAIIRRLAVASGIEGMVEGQMRDIASEGEVLDLEGLTALHRMKTGALIEASVWCGGASADGDSALLNRLSAYGRHIGLAFQVIDDMLNVAGDPKKLGKAVGTDALRRKNTYPSLIGMEASRKLAMEQVEAALGTVADLDHRSDPLRAIARYVIERDR
jgi:geranylgeranyl diphosphate synthase type II